MATADFTPSLVPGNDKNLVLNHFDPLGCAYVETDEAEADEWTIVSSIKDFELGRRENYFSPPARDFVERILGIAIFAR